MADDKFISNTFFNSSVYERSDPCAKGSVNRANWQGELAGVFRSNTSSAPEGMCSVMAADGMATGAIG